MEKQFFVTANYDDVFVVNATDEKSAKEKVRKADAGATNLKVHDLEGILSNHFDGVRFL